MELVQARLVTDDVAGLAAFYAELVGATVPLNGYYVEVPAGPLSVGFSKRRFTEEYCAAARACPGVPRFLGGAAGPGPTGRGAAGSGPTERAAAGSGPTERGAAGSGPTERGAAGSGPAGEMILDFHVPDVDAEHRRIAALGVDWVLLPTTQPWGSRSMVFHDPEGNLINVFSRR